MLERAYDTQSFVDTGAAHPLPRNGAISKGTQTFSISLFFLVGGCMLSSTMLETFYNNNEWGEETHGWLFVFYIFLL